MEFCSKCQKVVGVIVDNTGCFFDPDTDKAEVRFTHYCSECKGFLRNNIERSIDSSVKVVRDCVCKRQTKRI